MLKVRYSKEAQDFLRKVPAKHQKQIVTKILAFAEDQTSSPTKDLIGLHPLKRIKSGEYRIIIEYDHDELQIFAVGKRNDSDVYKTVKRRLA